MTKNEKYLFLLTILPVVIAGGCLTGFILNYRGIGQFLFASATLLLFLLAAGFTHRFINRQYIAPIHRLQQQLDEPSLLLNPADIDDGTPAQDLARSIQRQFQAINSDYQQQHAEGIHSKQKLNNQIDNLQSSSQSIQVDLQLLQNKSRLNQAYIQAITDLCGEPLMNAENVINNTIDNTINSTPATYNPDQQPDCNNVNGTVNKIDFLLNELQHRSLSASGQKTIDVHQLVDDAIALLTPLFYKQKISLLPIFDKSCGFEALGNRQILTAIVFNYLLAHHINDCFTNDLQLILKVQFPTDKLLSISLSGIHNQPTDIHARLQELMLLLNAQIKDAALLIPIICSAVPGQRIYGVNAQLIYDNDAQKQSAESRLSNLGICLTDKNPDFQLILQQDYPATSPLLNSSSRLSVATTTAHKPKILLANDQSRHCHQDCVKLSYPLHQQQLIEKIRANKSKITTQLKILAVDDSQSNLQLLSLLLSELGHQTITSNDPVKAIQICLQTSFDLIFMDIQMPVMSGILASKMIRSNGFEKPIIALTAHLSELEELQIKQAGMNDSLIKPADKWSLQNTIQQYLGSEYQLSSAPPAKVITSLPNHEPTIINKPLSLQRANNKPEFATEFLQLFMASLPADQQKANTACAAGNLIDFQASVHKIHGALQYCGIPRLEQTVRSLEIRLKQETQLQPKQLDSLLQSFNHEIALLTEWYLEYENKLPAYLAEH
ncbi:MAG: response regulator [Pseudomonadales bacterium]|nr:response regulator [Pseudomonadales bacterium]